VLLADEFAEVLRTILSRDYLIHAGEMSRRKKK
jgi:hypothetical protein